MLRDALSASAGRWCKRSAASRRFESLELLVNLLPTIDGEVAATPCGSLASGPNSTRPGRGRLARRGGRSTRRIPNFPPTTCSPRPWRRRARLALVLRPDDSSPAGGVRRGHFREHGGIAAGGGGAGVDHGDRGPAQRRLFQHRHFHHSRCDTWQPKLMPATATDEAAWRSNMSTACGPAGGRPPTTPSNLAFRFDAEAILFPFRRRAERRQDSDSRGHSRRRGAGESHAADLDLRDRHRARACPADRWTPSSRRWRRELRRLPPRGAVTHDR